MILGLDLGTTHTKAGVFTSEGNLLHTSSRKVVTRRQPSGGAFFDPDELWAAVVEIIMEVTQDIEPQEIAALGITSMAETGLLVENKTGDPRTPLIPWFDASASSQVDLLTKASDPQERFCRTGIRPNFKCSLAKLLWLRQDNPKLLQGTTWLSAADFIAYCLSGKMFTEYSLAGRTYAFRIDSKTWDDEWLATFGLNADLFPPAVSSGQPSGKISAEAASLTGLLQGTPVAICGHDHVCAAFAGVGIGADKIFDSMGTAEALLSSHNTEILGEAEYKSGLVFDCHVAGGGYYWMGGMSASGGSIEWLRGVLEDPALSYQEIESLLEMAKPDPTGILYFPYLSGSGSPHTDIQARGAFVGLKVDHTRADLVKAVFEGTAFEAEFIRQAAQNIMAKKINSIFASGGGTKMPGWMQIKADVSGCTIHVPTTNEAALLGAALIAGIGIGLYRDAKSAFLAAQKAPENVYQPVISRNHVYQKLYLSGFLPLQGPLRKVSRYTNMP